MSREVLQELVRDVRRLLAAGTAGLAGDAGLRRRGQALAALAAKVPALAPVAAAAGHALGAPSNAAAAALCELLSLTRQLQAGLASAGCDGAAVAVEKCGPWQTAAAVHDVLVWAAASFHPASNDYMAMRDAVGRPEFADLRLIQRLFESLGVPEAKDVEDAVEDVLGEQALPAFGATLLPELRTGLNLQGGIADVRRLRALCAVDPKPGTAACRQALAEGSTAVRVEALRQLTRLSPAEAERAALESVASKGRQSLREAAYRTLADSRDDRALEALVTALGDENGEWGIAWDSLARQRHPRTTARLLEMLADIRSSEAEAARARKARPKGRGKAAPDADEVRNAIGRVARVLGERQDRAAVPALIDLLGHKSADLRIVVIGSLESMGDLQGLRAAADLMGDAKVGAWPAGAAWLLPEPERYERLAPWVKALSRAKKSERWQGWFILDRFKDEFCDPAAGVEHYDDYATLLKLKEPRRDWDSRWAPLLRKYLDGPYRSFAAVALAAVLGKKAIPELLPRLAASVKRHECGVVEALGCLKAREAVPALVGLLPGRPQFFFCIHDALRRINDPTAVPLLEGVLHKTKEPYRRERIVAVVEHLEKNRTEA
jgi:HEAT repeat protein